MLFSIAWKLVAICAVSAIALGFLNAATAPRIETNKIRQIGNALGELTGGGQPGSRTEVEDDTVDAYFEIRENGVVVSYVLEMTGNGYGGPMKILANYLPDGEVANAKLMPGNKETPGLGKKAELPVYMEKFIGKGGTGETSIPTTPRQLAEQSTRSGGTGGPVQDMPAESYGGPLQGFLAWFFGKPAAGAADSVTGATITFVGISTTLEAGSDFVKNELGGDAE